MPGPSGWNQVVRPTAANRRPATYGVSHNKRHQFQHRYQQQHHPVNRRQLTTHPLWNGFVNVPRIEQQANVGQTTRPVQRPDIHGQQLQSQQHHRQHSHHAPNPRFLARLNNDLKQLWQASPVDRAAYTASTTLPAFSDDVPFSDSLFRVPMRPTTAYHRHCPVQQPQHQPAPQLPNFMTPNRTPATATDTLMMDFSSGTGKSGSLFTDGSAALPMGADFHNSAQMSDQTDGLFGNDFAGMHPVADEQQRRMRGLSACRLESISIQSTLPPQLSNGRASNDSSTTFAELCTSLRAAFRKCRKALYADGTYIDLATLRRRACQSKHGRRVSLEEPSAAYDPCPFSPMTMVGSALDGPGGCVTDRAASIAGSTFTDYFDQNAEDSMLMEADADSGCPSFGFDEDDAADNIEDSSGVDDSPLF